MFCIHQTKTLDSFVVGLKKKCFVAVGDILSDVLTDIFWRMWSFVRQQCLSCQMGIHKSSVILPNEVTKNIVGTHWHGLCLLQDRSSTIPSIHWHQMKDPVPSLDYHNNIAFDQNVLRYSKKASLSREVFLEWTYYRLMRWWGHARVSHLTAIL